MSKVLTYLLYRQKSHLYFKLNKKNINFQTVRNVLIGLFIISIILGLFVYARLFTIFSEVSSLYFILFIFLTLLTSGLGKALISSDAKVNKNNDLYFLITKPLTAKQIMLMKFFERNIHTEFFLGIHTLLLFVIFYQVQFNNVIFSIVVGVSLFISIYLFKILLFYYSFRKNSQVNIILFILSLVKIFSFVLLFLNLLKESNRLNDVSIVVYLQKVLNVVPVELLLVWVSSEIILLVVFVITLLFNILSFIFLKNKLNRGVFFQQKRTRQSKSYKLVHFKSNRTTFNILKLIFVYINRQKKQEIAITYTPFISSIISLILVCTILFIYIPEHLMNHSLLFYLFLSAFVVKMLTDTYCFLSSLDFFGQRFFMFKLSGVNYSKVISGQILVTSTLNTIISILIITPFLFVVPINISQFTQLLFISFVQIVLFNFIYYLSSATFPKFDVEQVTLLPSPKAKMVANFLIFISFAVEFLLFFLINDFLLFFLLINIFNVSYLSITYILILRKMPFVKLFSYK